MCCCLVQQLLPLVGGHGQIDPFLGKTPILYASDIQFSVEGVLGPYYPHLTKELSSGFNT